MLPEMEKITAGRILSAINKERKAESVVSPNKLPKLNALYAASDWDITNAAFTRTLGESEHRGNPLAQMVEDVFYHSRRFHSEVFKEQEKTQQHIEQLRAALNPVEQIRFDQNMEMLHKSRDRSRRAYLARTLKDNEFEKCKIVDGVVREVIGTPVTHTYVDGLRVSPIFARKIEAYVHEKHPEASVIIDSNKPKPETLANHAAAEQQHDAKHPLLFSLVRGVKDLLARGSSYISSRFMPARQMKAAT